MPQFGQLNEENVCIRNLFAVPGNILWLDKPIEVTGGLFARNNRDPRMGQ